MALTITYDGYGVVANADLKLNDTGGSGTGDWKELGGGTISENPDVYLFSGATVPASIGSKYASKTGYTYIDGITALDFGVSGAQENEMIYMWINIQSAGAFAPLATNGLAAMIGSATGDSYEWKIAGSDDANEWTGGWKLFVIDPTVNTGTVLNGTPLLTAVDTIGIWIDTDVSVRADSIFQSQIICTRGLVVTGSPTIVGDGLDEIVTWSTDYVNRAAGVFQRRGNTYFALGGLTVGDGSTATTLSTTGDSVEYEESSFWNGSAWVSSMPSTVNFIKTTANAAIVSQDSGYAGFIDNKLEIDTSLGNASSFKGGSLKLLRNIIVKATDVFDGVVFSNNDSLTLGAATYDNNTFNTSGTLILSGSVTSFTGNTLRASAGVTAVETSTASVIVDCIFESPSTGHGAECTAVGTYSWSGNKDTGYTGTRGTNLVAASGSADAMFYNNSGGLITLNVANGADSPSVRNSAGSTTQVNATFTLTLTDLIETTRVVIVNSITRALLSDQNVSATGTITYNHSGGEEVDIMPTHFDYKIDASSIYDLTLDNANQSIKFAQADDLFSNNPI